MFCMKCGTNMPDDSVFCPKCGMKVGLFAAFAGSVSTPAPDKSVRSSSGPECSEKNQLMMYVPGWGVYFIPDGERLCFYSGDTQVIEVLTKASGTVRICGLGYSGGKLS